LSVVLSDENCWGLNPKRALTPAPPLLDPVFLRLPAPVTAAAHSCHRHALLSPSDRRPHPTTILPRPATASLMTDEHNLAHPSLLSPLLQICTRRRHPAGPPSSSTTVLLRSARSSSAPAKSTLRPAPQSARLTPSMPPSMPPRRCCRCTSQPDRHHPRRCPHWPMHRLPG
jgi:hypothetical protein